MMKKCSVSSLKDNPESFAKKIEMEGKPMGLTHNGKVIALLYDPSVYKQTEQKRRKLEALLVGVSFYFTSAEFVPTVGRRPMLPAEHQNFLKLKEYIYKNEKLQSQINSLKCNLYEKGGTIAGNHREGARTYVSNKARFTCQPSQTD